MKNYLSLVARYLSVHKKKTRLNIISVAVSVALITGVFSMLDVLLKFEKVQVIHDYGNYHIAVRNVSDEEADTLRSRIDVEKAGKWIPLGTGSINGVPGILGALDQDIAENMNVNLVAGKYPTKQNEIMLEQWAMEGLHQNFKINDSVEIALADNRKKKYVISGIYYDFGHTKAKGIPGIFLSASGAHEFTPKTNSFYLIKFKDGVNITAAEKEIKNTLHIAEARIDRNNHLLAVIGQSRHKAATGFYTIGAILFGIVLVAGVVMMYNTFNISVMERVRQFGLLRCIGASKAQIEKLVKRESLYIARKAIPLGVFAGMLITFICSAILKYFNANLFREIPLFTVSFLGIGAGIVIGFLTVFIASLLPAKKAAKVSPINAVTGVDDQKIAKTRKRGFLTGTVRAEIAMGINNAVIKKKTLFLMSCSVALSIIMFLGFQVFVDFMHTSLKTTKPYTPDLSLSANQGLSDEQYAKLSRLDGVDKVYGRKFGYIDAAFKADRLTDTYKKEMPGIKVKPDGLFVPREKSWLISYDKKQLNWAKADLLSGVISEDKINEQNGVIAVALTTRKGVRKEYASLRLGDKVYVNTSDGTKVLTVIGILRTVPLDDSKPNLTTFITTEKIFAQLQGESLYKAIDLQLKSQKQDQTIKKVKGIINNSVTLRDLRQRNAETDQIYLTMAVFVYGFVAVIGLISVLNIINTMNTSVASKTRYLGVMRAVGMSGKNWIKWCCLKQQHTP